MSTRASLNNDMISRLKLRLPTLDQQKSIAHILGTLDDKIELNRQMNETLEGMAQALFKSWFVDFDPVIDNAIAAGNDIPDVLKAKAIIRRKVACNCNPLPSSIRQQFSSLFEYDDDTGWIPQGWTVDNFSRIAVLNPESWTKKNAPDSVQYVDLSNTKNGRISLITSYEYSEAPSRARRVLVQGDTIIGTVRPGNRSFAYINNDGLTGSTGFAVMRPLDKDFRSFVYFGLTQDAVIDDFAHLADGGAYPAIRPEVVANYDHVFPSDEIIKAFDSLVHPSLEKIGQQEADCKTLAKLRDTLLPKLLSGELRIPDAEKLVSEAL